MNRPRPRVAAAAAVVAVACAWAAPAAAGPRPTIDDLVIEAQIELDSEILALVELDAFGPEVPDVLLDVHAEWAEFVTGLDRDGLLEWVVDADASGAEALRQLDLADVPVTPEIQRTVGPLGQADLDAIADDRPITIDPGIYVRARGQLTLGMPTPATPISAPAVTAPGITAPPAEASNETGPIIAIALSLGVLAAGAWALVRRRPLPNPGGRSAMQEQLFDQLSDAARRMAGALDEEEIARIAIAEAMQMVHARHGAFIDVSEFGLTAMATSGDVLAVQTLTGGLLSRVADTGQSVRRIAHDEPAVTSLPASLLAVPVIGSGRVTAILFLVRPDSAPFTDADEAAINRLAPIVASARGAASRHGDATALSRIDALTGLANRRRLDEDLAALAAAATGRTTALAMIDVDHFKHFNDRNGHTAGDDALRAVAAAILRAVRPRDRVYRYGGEEFTLVLSDIDRREAEHVAERVRAEVERIDLPGSAEQPSGTLTVSLGVALVEHGAPEAALQLADSALYEAKSAGRNRVVITESVA